MSEKENNQGSGEGRGSVSNDRGSTTYKRNERNPTGFNQIKRIDTKGAAHKNVPTPHVQEGKSIRPAEEHEIPKSDLSKNKE